MAALIAAEDSADMKGVAPEASILPIRIAVDQGKVIPADQVTAIDVAVSAGARVIALGSYVDMSIPEVRQAVESAARHDVVVVVAGPFPDDGSLPRQVIRVGAVDKSLRPTQQYSAGTIDLAAPGAEVASLSAVRHRPMRATGPQYAVALAAGAAALLRGAYPSLSAEAVSELMRDTATPVSDGSGATDVRMLDLAAAMASPPPVAQPVTSTGGGGGLFTLAMTAISLILLAVVSTVLLRRRRKPKTVTWNQPNADDDANVYEGQWWDHTDQQKR
jgi:hypothetical protein